MVQKYAICYKRPYYLTKRSYQRVLGDVILAKSYKFAPMKLISICVIVGGLLVSVSCGTDVTEVTPDPNPDLDNLIAANPESIPLLVKRGEKLFAAYEYDLALVDAAKAFRLDTNDLSARLLYAEVINSRATRTPQEVTTAQRMYGEYLKKKPDSKRALVGYASTYSYQFDFNNSFKYINMALKLDKHYRDGYVLKGSNYMQIGDIDKAKSSYETAVQQDPEFYEAYFKLGQIYQAENDPRCIEYFTSAYKLKPEFLEFKYQIAYSMQIHDRVDEAKELYSEMAKDTVEFYVVRGLFHQGHIHQFMESNIDSAIYYYESALKTEPRYVEAWHNLGMCYDIKGNKTQALKSFSKALKYNPNFELSRVYADSIRLL
ncbi:MAG: tetratricopeptide (TPR) repeat protein [Salibacteraceae bacterium]|jgi:tetratricopeptide (TPR) repeat protein